MTGRIRPPARIVSGGQSGADRAALDYAKRAGIAYGGWCPRGGWAEDLPDPPGLLADYPHLQPTPTGDVAQRTTLNVRDSDATVILHRRGLASRSTSGGTSLTRREAHRLGRPVLVLDIDETASVAQLAELVRGLPERYVVNVAGPRESELPGLYRRSLAFLEAAFGACPA